MPEGERARRVAIFGNGFEQVGPTARIGRIGARESGPRIGAKNRGHRIGAKCIFTRPRAAFAPAAPAAGR
jgi:hypothetical protein